MPVPSSIFLVAFSYLIGVIAACSLIHWQRKVAKVKEREKELQKIPEVPRQFQEYPY